MENYKFTEVYVERPALTIVIVNFNGGEMVLACIDSAIKETITLDYEVIVVDNDSSDGSVGSIRERFPNVKVIESGANLGFAAANNIGFAAAAGEFILLLNPDAEITDGAIEKSLAYMRGNPEVGVMGCRTLWNSGERQSTLMRFPTLMDFLINIFVPYKLMRRSRWLGRARYVGLDDGLEHDVEVVAGCFMMLPRSVIDEVGGLDDDFFMFGEEVEWCWRIQKSGRKVRYFPGSTIVHHGGGCSSTLSYRKTLLIAKGQLMVFRKTRGAFVSFIANLLMLIRDIPRALLWGGIRLLNRAKAERSISLKSSYIRLSFLLPHLFGIEKRL